MVTNTSKVRSWPSGASRFVIGEPSIDASTHGSRITNPHYFPREFVYSFKTNTTFAHKMF